MLPVLLGGGAGSVVVVAGAGSGAGAALLATTLCAYIVWLVLYEYTTPMSLEHACTLRAPGTISYALYKRWRISAQQPQPYPPCILRAVPTAEVYLL